MPLHPVSRTVDVNAPAEQVFALLADPNQHPVLDGSGTVRGCEGVTLPLQVGSTFVMRMRLPTTPPYRSVNEIVELDPPRLIAWRTQPRSRFLGLAFGGHCWRFEIEPTEAGCRVTETWDPSTFSKPTFAVRAMRFQQNNVTGIEATLARLEDHFA